MDIETESKLLTPLTTVSRFKSYIICKNAMGEVDQENSGLRPSILHPAFNQLTILHIVCVNNLEV